MKRVIQFEIKPNKMQEIVLNSLGYAASKLWNVANYERKQWKKESGILYPDWYDQKKRLKDNFWYKNLPSQTAQEVLKQLNDGWKSFYKLNKTKGMENPKPPKYKQNEMNIRWLNNGFSIENDNIILSISKLQKDYLKQKHGIGLQYLYIPIPEKYSIKGNPKVIEIIPLKEGYKVYIIVELPESEVKTENEIYMSIDLGVNNLITCYCNTGKSMIISGRQLLSINRYYDKEISYYQGISDAQQSAGGIKYPKKSKKVLQLYGKRSGQVKHLLHDATKKVIDFAVKEKVSKIIIGDITGIRDNNNMGSVNNQKLHKLPFKQIENLLTYKAETQGIICDKQEESYTSQCSPYAEEVCKENAKKSNRKQRGLYVVNGELFNADCVGAYNIMKKYLRGIGKTITAVVGLDTPMMYRWDSVKGFVLNQKLAISMAM